MDGGVVDGLDPCACAVRYDQRVVGGEARTRSCLTCQVVKKSDNLLRKSSNTHVGWTDAHDVDGHTEFTSVPFREELVTPKPYPRFRVSGGASRTFGERDPRGKTSGLGKKKPFFSYLKFRPVTTRA